MQGEGMKKGPQSGPFFIGFISLKLSLHNLTHFQGNLNKPPQKLIFFKVLLPMLVYNRHRFPMNPSWLKAHYYDQ